MGKRPSSVEYTELAQFCCWCEWTPFCTSSEKSVFTRGCQSRSARTRTIIYRSCLMITLYQPPDNCMINILKFIYTFPQVQLGTFKSMIKPHDVQVNVYLYEFRAEYDKM
jgi:hypothetical protein